MSYRYIELYEIWLELFEKYKRIGKKRKISNMAVQMTKKYIFVLFLFIIAIKPLFSQVQQSHSFIFSFLQLKDQHNLGMVFNGVKLEYRYGLIWKIQDHEIIYQPKIGFGIGFNRKMTGYQINIAPINVTWTMSLFGKNGHQIKGGVNFITDYSYQMYPDLHAAHLFWASEIGISPVIKYYYQWENKRIGIYLQNSLFGFTSNKQEFDTYFYSLAVKDFFITPHENMKFGSFNNYNHTNIMLEFVPNTLKMHSFMYEIDYFNSFYGKQFERLTHSLFWRMSI